MRTCGERQERLERVPVRGLLARRAGLNANVPRTTLSGIGSNHEHHNVERVTCRDIRVRRLSARLAVLSFDILAILEAFGARRDVCPACRTQREFLDFARRDIQTIGDVGAVSNVMTRNPVDLNKTRTTPELALPQIDDVKMALASKTRNPKEARAW